MSMRAVRWHIGEDEPLTVETITVQQDVGGPFPVYKGVTLDLMSDGTVRWRDVTLDGEIVVSQRCPTSVGD